MKRSAILLVLVVLTAQLCACTNGGAPLSTPTPTPEASPMPTPVPTTPPDFEDVDFSGVWKLAEVWGADGEAVSPERIAELPELAELGPDFTLEFTKSGDYFLYDTSGALRGQGQYRVEKAELILIAGEMRTIYAIRDADTLRCTAGDGSVTVMKRVAEKNKEEAVASPDEPDMETGSAEPSES